MNKIRRIAAVLALSSAAIALPTTPQASAVGGCTYFILVSSQALANNTTARTYYVYDPVHWTYCYTTTLVY